MSRAVGRPRAAEATPDRAAILDAALALLDAGGTQALTMRALAARLGISPMAVYHRVGDRTALISAVADRILAGITSDDAARLLAAYCEAVLEHPQLLLALFTTPSGMSREARRITAELDRLLPPAGSPRLRDLLIDYTHGYALAVAGNAMGAPRERGGVRADYAAALALLLPSGGTPGSR